MDTDEGRGETRNPFDQEGAVILQKMLGERVAVAEADDEAAEHEKQIDRHIAVRDRPYRMDPVETRLAEMIDHNQRGPDPPHARERSDLCRHFPHPSENN